MVTPKVASSTASLTGAATGMSVLGDANPLVQARVLDHLDSASTTAHTGAAEFPDQLSNRELGVLQLIANGLVNTEIATRPFATDATIETHSNHIFTKTGVRDRAQGVRYAYQHGLATP